MHLALSLKRKKKKERKRKERGEQAPSKQKPVTDNFQNAQPFIKIELHKTSQ